MESIIVYRNPGEKWFWEGGAIIVGGVVLVFFISFTVLHWLFALIKRREMACTNPTIPLWLAGFITCFFFYFTNMR